MYFSYIEMERIAAKTIKMFKNTLSPNLYNVDDLVQCGFGTPVPMDKKFIIGVKGIYYLHPFCALNYFKESFKFASPQFFDLIKEPFTVTVPGRSCGKVLVLEKSSEYIARAIVMPEAEFRKEWKKSFNEKACSYNIGSIAEKFRVSRNDVLSRADDLYLLDKERSFKK